MYLCLPPKVCLCHWTKTEHCSSCYTWHQLKLYMSRGMSFNIWDPWNMHISERYPLEVLLHTTTIHTNTESKHCTKHDMQTKTETVQRHIRTILVCLTLICIQWWLLLIWVIWILICVFFSQYTSPFTSTCDWCIRQLLQIRLILVAWSLKRTPPSFRKLHDSHSHSQSTCQWLEIIRATVSF